MTLAELGVRLRALLAAMTPVQLASRAGLVLAAVSSTLWGLLGLGWPNPYYAAAWLISLAGVVVTCGEMAALACDDDNWHDEDEDEDGTA